MMAEVNLKMRQLIISSLYFLTLWENILRLNGIIEELKFIKQDISILEQEVIKLKIRKEIIKSMIKRRFQVLCKYSPSFTFNDDDFCPISYEDIKKGYCYLGENQSHILVFRTGLVVPNVASNIKIVEKKFGSALDYFNIFWPIKKLSQVHKQE